MRTSIVLAVVLVLVASAAAAGRPAGTPRLPGTLAFSAGTKARGYQVYVMKPGGLTVQATHQAARHDYPATPIWSPDGSRLAVVGEDGLYVVSPDGASEVRIAGLSPGYARQGVAWSPDSRRLLFDASDAVYVVNADGSGGLERLPRSNGGGSWSPDGRRIAYTGIDANRRPVVFVVSAAGASRATQLFPSRRHPLKKGCYPSASWSPAGTEIALGVDCGYRPLGGWVYTIHPDGTGLRFRRRGNLRPWSPDGAMLLVTKGFNADWELFVVRDARSPKRVPGCSRGCWPVVWLPSGRALAYGERGTIGVTGLDGSRSRLVAKAPAYEFSLAPNGTSFAFTSGLGRGHRRKEISIVRADGSGRRVIAQSKTLTYWSPAWRPR